jgi:Lon protease-like protein
VSARTLPLFPLPVVLFPGVALPLHIFEPRYRRMLADCLASDRRFGLIFLPESTAERDLPQGQVGCVAHIESAEPLPDGRSNIIVSGEDRFALERFIESQLPYHVARVTGYTDLPEPREPLESLADEVRTLFERVAQAARLITDDRSPVPELPSDPTLLAYRIASLIDTTPQMRYQLLASRSALGRLREMQTLLADAVSSLERRAAMHQHAKRNGRGYGPAPTDAGA